MWQNPNWSKGLLQEKFGDPWSRVLSLQLSHFYILSFRFSYHNIIYEIDA